MDKKKEELIEKMLENIRKEESAIDLGIYMAGYEKQDLVVLEKDYSKLSEACAKTAINFTIETLEKVWPHSSDVQKALKELKKIQNPK